LETRRPQSHFTGRGLFFWQATGGRAMRADRLNEERERTAPVERAGPESG
jgi:hypothetical protein